MYDVYWAAPLSRNEDAARNLEYVVEFRRAGLMVFLPQEVGRIADYKGEDIHKRREMYFAQDISALLDSTCLVMFLAREPSAGACFEAGYARARNKYVFGLNVADVKVGTFLECGARWFTEPHILINAIKEVLK
jgi:nucleoside 2-deoxyribosyltransferase